MRNLYAGKGMTAAQETLMATLRALGSWEEKLEPPPREPHNSESDTPEDKRLTGEWKSTLPARRRA